MGSSTQVKGRAVELLDPLVQLPVPSRKSRVTPTPNFDSLLKKVKLGQEYNVEKWIHECCVGLAHSTEEVDYEVFLDAGVRPKTIAKLAKTREKVLMDHARQMTTKKEEFKKRTKKVRCTNCQEVEWGMYFDCREMCWREEEHRPQAEFYPLGDEFNCFGCNRPLRMLDVQQEIYGNLVDEFRNSGFQRDK